MPFKKFGDKSTVRGIPVSEGIAIGKVWILESPWDEVDSYPVKKGRIDAEIERYRSALTEVGQQIVECKDRVFREIGEEEAGIFDAHHAILNDPFFQGEIIAAIKNQKRNVEFILKEGVDRLTLTFQQMENDYFRQRMDDIKDVAMRLLRVLLQTEEVRLPIKHPSILVAHSLSPSDTARVDNTKVLGFATELGGATSHASILARSLGLPAVVGAEKLLKLAQNGDTIIVDGNSGIIHINPHQQIVKEYQKRQREFRQYWKRLSQDAQLDTITRDGTAISLQANVAMSADVKMANDFNAAGVGLFRTELPFLAAGRLLTAEEQYKIYKSVVVAMEGKPVTIRTLDLGGDKFLPFQGVEEESNPFMGWRSIRISLQERDVFKDQLGAILRASRFGKVRLLYPMISSVEELIEIYQVLEETKDDLRRDEIPFDEEIQTGIMIEVPSAAILADRLIRFTDHFSIGTNDLIQYTLAVDRNNEKVAKFYKPLNPAILNLIYNTIKAAEGANKSVSLCGEIAGDPFFTPLLLGLGLREFSMSPLMIPEVKERIRAVTIQECEALACEVMGMVAADEIYTLLEKFNERVDEMQTVPYMKRAVEEDAISMNQKKSLDK